MGRACRKHGEKPNACKILVEKPEGKSSLERPRRRWTDMIETSGVSITFSEILE
jgi:hypothetical protein